MPLSLVPVMVLRDTLRPCASNETTAVAAMLVKMLPEMSPETCSSQMPLPPRAGDLAIGDADVAAAKDMDQAAPCRQRNAAAVEA